MSPPPSVTSGISSMVSMTWAMSTIPRLRLSCAGLPSLRGSTSLSHVFTEQLYITLSKEITAGKCVII